MKEYTKKLGEILLKEKLITKDQLEQALKTQKQSKMPLGEILRQINLVNEKDIALALSKQLNIHFVTLQIDLLKVQITDDLKKLIPENYARTHFVLPLAKDGNTLTIACDDPLNLDTIDDLKKTAECEIKPVIATRSNIIEAIDIIYGKRDLLKEAINSSYTLMPSEWAEKEMKEDVQLDALIASAEQAPVIKLVDLIINEAIESRASDIHLEPFEQSARIRYRIDGILYEISPPAKHLYLAIISRVKILSKLDIAEKRLPQDGSFGVKKANKLIDIRVSSIPTIYGEKIVMRILDRTMTPLELEDLGFTSTEQELFERYISRTTGLVLLTGPTGCGKTTTLYAALNRIKSPEKNIITIEDPVEYHLDGVNQVHVNPKIGLTFANGLRAFLRQDPDIMMVGEVRDLETAQICVRASLTGHLVFSTVHTNDSVSAVTRLINIGLEPYLVTSSLIMVVAQRLIRRLCMQCREEYAPTPEIIKNFDIKEKKIFRAKGCKKCRMTGYYGQIAIYEILPISEEIKELITENKSLRAIKELACRQGLKTLRQSAIEKVAQGTTSIEDALRVTMGFE